MKSEILAFLKEKGHTVTDVGSHDPSPVDFPDIARFYERLQHVEIGDEAGRRAPHELYPAQVVDQALVQRLLGLLHLFVVMPALHRQIGRAHV